MGLTKLVLVFSFFCCIFADTPANCTYSDIQGDWKIYESARGNHDKTLDGCNAVFTPATNQIVSLSFPDRAVDEFGNEETWTLIYNQGFEVIINGRKLFMFSAYDQKADKSLCSDTSAGWGHNVNGGDWTCVKGQRMESPADSRTVLYKDNSQRFFRHQEVDKSAYYRPNHNYIKLLNRVQNSWSATLYPEYEKLTLNDLHLRAGGPKSKIAGIPVSNQLKRDGLEEEVAALPDSFDWRSVQGRSFVTPVRNQGSCGSCYSFSSVGMTEGRLMMFTNGSVDVSLSPQDVVECCQYSQGCDGGFPYLVAGKYGEDFGLASESCNPYTGKDGACSTSTSDSCRRRYYNFRYRYVGGYYGACGEEEMKLALMRGPLSVSFEVYSDFTHYKSGVYHHVSALEDKFNPFEITNHAVLLVGWGTDPVGGPYWTVKNSWGETWGEDGYFRIRRGSDECSIESLALEAFPVL